jgi:hypothetical protein
MHGQPDGETGIDNEMMAEQSFAGVGAWILGRNMSARFEALLPPSPMSGSAGSCGGKGSRPSGSGPERPPPIRPSTQKNASAASTGAARRTRR